MSKMIGFANKYYTLWNYRTEPEYVQDAYGKYWQVGNKEIYEYIKNISFDLDKVKTLFPNVPINDELRGISQSWSRKSELNYPAGFFWWGKYTGKSYDDVIQNDFKYMLWAIENNEGIKNWALTNPIYIKYLEEEEAKYNEKLNSVDFPKVGDIISIDFTTNGRGGYDYDDRNYVQGNFNDINMIVMCDIKEVNGLYPYLMPFINGKFQKTKNKTITVKVSEVIEQEVYGNSSARQTIKIY